MIEQLECTVDDCYYEKYYREADEDMLTQDTTEQRQAAD
jgi:hypothetical protein